MRTAYRAASAVLIPAILAGSFPASAATVSGAPYQGYEYNSRSESIAAPVGYTARPAIFGTDMSLQTPVGAVGAALYWGEDPDASLLYLLDGENGRIVSLDTDYRVMGVYDRFVLDGTMAVDIADVRDFGVNTAGDRFYLASPSAGAVYVADPGGRVTQTVTAADVGAESFRPWAAALDGEDTLYIADAARTDGYYTVTDSGTEYVRTGGRITDFCYNAETGCLYALDVTRAMVLNLTDGEEIPLEVTPSARAALATDAYADCFYIGEPSGAVYKTDSWGALESEWETAGLTALACNGEKEQLAVFGTGGDGLRMAIYRADDRLIEERGQPAFALEEPSDMVYDGGDAVYLLDSGHGRILELDTTFTSVRRVIGAFMHGEERLNITGAGGMAADAEGRLYVADTVNYRVLACDGQGRVQTVITRPDEALYDTDAPFRATKVMTDRGGKIYVAADTINLGMLVFTRDGAFDSFFGANTVTPTAEVILNYIRKRFLTRAQMQAIQKYTPVSLVNMDIDPEGFIYTVPAVDQSKPNSDKRSLIRKLNHLSENVYRLAGSTAGLGDLDWNTYPVRNTAFVDIDIDEKGFINVVDSARNKVFQYSQAGQLVAAFGGSGTQTGRFTMPSAVESIGDGVYVLDKLEGSVTEFRPTAYVQALRRATLLLDGSDTGAALAAWTRVLEYNTNSQYAYYGRGLAYEMMGEYRLAMENFRLAEAKPEYSKAMREYRKTYIRDNFWWIGLSALAGVAALAMLTRLLKKRLAARHGGAYSAMETKWGLPVYALLHPVDGFEQFRGRNLQSMWISAGLVALWFLLRVFDFFCTGFAFNANRAVDYNLPATLASTAGVYVLFVAANWAMTTFLDGKGRLREIVAVTAYSLIPMLAAMFLRTLMTNVLTLEEAAFLGIVTGVGYLWSGLLLLLGLSVIHQYSVTRTVASVALTALGMAVIALLLILTYTLMLQCVGFVQSIAYEWKIR